MDRCTDRREMEEENVWPSPSCCSCLTPLSVLSGSHSPVVLGKVSGLLSIIREPLSNLQLLVGTMEIT